MALIDTINAGLNNPDCAYFVGHYTGSLTSVKLLIGLTIAYFVFKVIDAFVFEPLLNKIKTHCRK